MANYFPFICVTCGTQFPESAEAPQSCPICEDERQYVGFGGQQWTTPEELRKGHGSRIEEVEPDLVGIGCEPSFAIGQRALLVRTGEGNLLWDCISLLDDGIVAAVERLGGIDTIAVSHPHFYTSMVEWANAFGARILLHAADSEHVMRRHDSIEFWRGETLELFGGLTLIRAGGHFDGGTVLHWAQGAGGKGALLAGDIIMVVPDRRWVSFMYSYPNLIPMSAAKVREVAASVEPFEFDRIYGGWWERVVDSDGKGAVTRSVERYVRSVGGPELEES